MISFCIMATKKKIKKNKWSKITKHWNKFDKAVSDFFDEDEEESEDNEEKYLELNLSFEPLKKFIFGAKDQTTHVRVFITITLIIILFSLSLLLLSSVKRFNPADNIVPKQSNGTYIHDDGTPMYTTLPVLKYNPNNSHAMLVVKEEVFLRATKEYEIYIDIIYYPIGENIPKRAILMNSIAGLPTKPDVMIGKEVPYPGAFSAIVHVSVPLKRTINGWVSEKFVINPIEPGNFIVLWGKYEKFPLGTVSGVLFEQSDEI